MSNIFRRVLLVLTASGKVTVLLSIIVLGGVRADDVTETDTRMFEFTSEFYMVRGNGRIDGLMASDGSRHRIAIYWIEPAVFRDHTFFLGNSDFIFTEAAVHYYVHGQAPPGTLDLSGGPTDQLLPGDVSVESVARSVLAIVNRIRSDPKQGNAALEIGKFFRQGLDQTTYSYEVPYGEASSENASGSRASDVQVMNALPYGRKYSKEIQSDGAIVWRAQRALDGRPVVRVTVKPVSGVQPDEADGVFDKKTLGQWSYIPRPYRAYWSFDRAYLELADGSDHRVSSYELHDKIETYLDKNNIPDRIAPAFNQLQFKTAMLTGDTNRVSRSAHSVIAALCRDASASSYRGLLELARIDARIREKYPEQADDLVCPLAGLMVKHAGPDAQQNLEKLMPAITGKKWFAFGKLLFEEVRVQSLAEADILDALADRFETARLAEEGQPSDPCEASASVKQYFTRLDINPPKGTLTMDDIRYILKEGLEKPCADANLDSADELVEDTIRSIKLIAGEGPFRGDQDKLLESIKRFSGLYLVVFRYKEPIDTVLATFLALSFCDTSTAEGHDALFSQIRKLCAEFQSLTNSMLAERGLSELVAPSDVERLFSRYKQRFRTYVDDPLWPAFKFPLTAKEQTMLRNKLKQCFDRLEPALDEAALKVKYGGVSDELKVKTRYEIARAILQLLPQAAFLRRPPYPGVSCRYRGTYGFVAVIRGPLYKEGERPREKFKAMKYFHMGHRLEEIVKRERELTRP